MSCNGCRVLRKGCGVDCTLRPSLQWIKSADSQANATVFLAKFYGRAGLLNLIGAGPTHLRPEILRSLLYEACGRIINPVYGSAGLMRCGEWHRCQAAVDAVLRGWPLERRPGGRVQHPAPLRRLRFTITGWSGEGEWGRRSFPAGSEASHDSASVETVEPSLTSPVGKPDPGFGLELTLGSWTD
ncbi:LOB domain-containing protein [Striga asiatica]|uniref:LOB domain-containing protein n=1 Tax=Striga asiatica TaxID=4170 RepID=A0A5A7PBI7_STRAF|nr:LOB domain-containing protein [Striga asiatica]